MKKPKKLKKLTIDKAYTPVPKCPDLFLCICGMTLTFYNRERHLSTLSHASRMAYKVYLQDRAVRIQRALEQIVGQGRNRYRALPR